MTRRKRDPRGDIPSPLILNLRKMWLPRGEGVVMDTFHEVDMGVCHGPTIDKHKGGNVLEYFKLLQITLHMQGPKPLSSHCHRGLWSPWCSSASQLPEYTTELSGAVRVPGRPGQRAAPNACEGGGERDIGG